MTMKYAKAEDIDVLAHQAEYARNSGGDVPSEIDPIADMTKLREMLVQKRRYLAHDALAYPISYMGRALDLSRLQDVIDTIDRALADERTLAAKA